MVYIIYLGEIGLYRTCIGVEVLFAAVVCKPVASRFDGGEGHFLVRQVGGAIGGELLFFLLIIN